MKILFLWSISAILCLPACQSPVAEKTDAESIPVVQTPYQPSLALDDLFHDIQMAGIFPDSKTLVDCRPLSAPRDILSDYHQLKDEGPVDLEAFVNQHFEITVNVSGGSVQSKDNMFEHLNALWVTLTRTPDEKNSTSSLLPLPYPYVVPGGRFREIYYWDSYFTMLGLLESQEDSLVVNMIRNFGYLIDTYGFIPNGNRSYYMGRSQPPFFSSMVMLWANRHGIKAALPFLPQLHKEYNFWMRGKDLLDESNSSHQRVVQLPDGTVLNRYWDNFSDPRPESYKEDYELAETFPTDQREQVYRHLRAGAESGWDYSSRWFSDGKSLDSIITTQILPVDLNCLLYFLESSISTLNLYSGDSVQARFFQKLSDNRATAIQNYFWDSKAGYFVDYNIQMGKTTEQFSAAGMVPLYFQVATIEQAQNAVVFLQENLLFPGGVVSTTQNTGQQWDFPNGWAPQQWMTIQGLHNYQHHALADDITSRWLSITERVYSNTGKMMEKYNVVDLSLTAGGGEYTTQDGFGWTNGVTLALWSLQENGSNSNTQ